MENRQNSRRKFLSSLAILSACVPFASQANLFPDGYSTTDLRGHWKMFCRVNGGKQQDGLFNPGYEAAINQCKGHSYQTGELIYFPNEHLMAQPTWIYWGHEKSKPADVIVTFFYDDRGQKKVFRINRFELEGLCKLSENNSQVNLLAILYDDAQNHHFPGHEKKLDIKTRVKNGGRVHILAAVFDNKISVEKKLIYFT